MNFRIVVFIAIMAFILVPQRIFAQYDERESGIYATVGEKIIPLNRHSNPFSFGTATEVLLLPITIEDTHKRYDGETSEVQTSGPFVLVIDHNKKVFVSPFFETLSPCYLKLIPLTVNHELHCREYETTITTSFNFPVSLKDHGGAVDFEWERISENSFEISILDVKPGEYAFVFCNAEGTCYDYGTIYDFTIPEQ